MSPRKRAEALGWRRVPNEHFPNNLLEHLWKHPSGARLFPYRPHRARPLAGPLGWNLSIPHRRTVWGSSDEDEALEHALLLRDVWLS